MLAAFICPDGVSLPITECLAACRMGQRCLSLPTLREVATIRPWDGTPSVTQLLNGTMLEYLQITKDYAVSPKSRAFALLGTQHHARLSGAAFDLVSEEGLEFEGIRGHPDLLEATYDGYALTDYKTWGSYRLARYLGLVGEKIDDPSGAVYQKSGAWGRVGTPKQVTVWVPNPLSADTFEPDMQLNMYRVMAINNSIPVNKMELQVTVRDGGLRVAEERGITDSIYLLPVDPIPDSRVVAYFTQKAEQLIQALAGLAEPVICTTEERWEDERCKRYCPVAGLCYYGREVKDV